MIHLDSNYLIRGQHLGSAESSTVTRWLEREEPLATSAIAWMEFVTGPAAPEAVESMREAIENRIVDFGEEEAVIAARLYNAIGRRRAHRFDCMIAASAIHAGARLATSNNADFHLFVPHGLKLAP